MPGPGDRTSGRPAELQAFYRAEEHWLLTPEYAYLTDLRHQRADGDWKALRKAKAKSALETLARILPVRAAEGRLSRSNNCSFPTELRSTEKALLEPA